MHKIKPLYVVHQQVCWSKNEKGFVNLWFWGNKDLLNLKSYMLGGVVRVKCIGLAKVLPP
jgi:hypothetical protein